MRKLNRQIPTSVKQAVQWLRPTVDASANGSLPKMNDDTLEKGWCAIAFLYGGLHPDNLSHGTCDSEGQRVKEGIVIQHYDDLRLLPYCSECGWPNILRPVAEEVSRRRIELYQSGAALAGLRYLLRHPHARFA